VEFKNPLLQKIEIAKPQSVSTQPSDLYEEEKTDLDRQKAEVELIGAQQDIEERRKYAHRIFCLIVGWLIAVAAILFLQGFHDFFCGITFNLPVSVLLATIGGTTASVLGIFIIVTKYLFPSR
jgi:uncharacterized membrane protein